MRLSSVLVVFLVGCVYRSSPNDDCTDCLTDGDGGSQIGEGGEGAAIDPTGGSSDSVGGSENSSGGSLATGGDSSDAGGDQAGGAPSGGSGWETSGGASSGGSASGGAGSGGAPAMCTDSACLTPGARDHYCGGDPQDPTCSPCSPGWCNCSQGPTYEPGGVQDACEYAGDFSGYSCSAICQSCFVDPELCP